MMRIAFAVLMGLRLLLLTAAPASAAADPPPGWLEDGIVSITDCEGCPPLVRVPPSAPGNPALLVARHELTWAEYLPSVQEAGCPLPPLHREEYPEDLRHLADNLPLTNVPPTQIGCYLSWLQQKTGRTYRLPSAEEWEHAARAGSPHRFPWGDELEPGRAAIIGRFDRRDIGFEGLSFDVRRDLLGSFGWVPVESFPPNAWGLYDVVGNVAEYVAKTQPPTETCFEVKDRDYCELIAFRGGSPLHYDDGQLAGYDQDFLKLEQFTLAGAPQPPGYRLVRDDE